MITRPLLAVHVSDLKTLEYPVFVSSKFDGYRCLVVNGKAVSRTFKPIRNGYTREWLEKNLPSDICLDGELMLRDPAPFNEISSAFSSFEGKPDFVYHIFDAVDDLDTPYLKRYSFLKSLIKDQKLRVRERITAVTQWQARDSKGVKLLYKDFLEAGFEGAIIRSKYGRYKCGRSTLKEGILLKYKRLKDSEGKIIGFEELEHNLNKVQKDAFGNIKRSSHKANKVKGDTLGAVIIRDIHTEIEVKVGTGFDAAMRAAIWEHRKGYKGKIIKYQYQEEGSKDKPRFPRFVGFRCEDDL